MLSFHEKTDFAKRVFIRYMVMDSNYSLDCTGVKGTDSLPSEIQTMQQAFNYFRQNKIEPNEVSYDRFIFNYSEEISLLKMKCDRSKSDVIATLKNSDILVYPEGSSSLRPEFMVKVEDSFNLKLILNLPIMHLPLNTSMDFRDIVSRDLESIIKNNYRTKFDMFASNVQIALLG